MRQRQAKAFKEMKGKGREPGFAYEGWQIAAYDRATGKALWTHDLPEEPLLNGLAIAADGSVLVTLRDGGIVCVK